MFAALVIVLAVLKASALEDDNWKVVGGSMAGEGAYPYQVSLKVGRRHICGGSIINTTTILTAAHCVYGVPVQFLTVLAGSNHLDQGHQAFKVEGYVRHPEFEGTKNDIALIKLADPIQYTEKIQPVVLETKFVGADVTCVLSGWGMVNFPSEEAPNDLQHIVLKTIDNAECATKQNFTHPPIYESNVCTFTQKGEGACKGDSGGPLVADGKQIGIVSWGRPCAKGIPDVFTRVSAYIDWINTNSF